MKDGIPVRALCLLIFLCVGCTVGIVLPGASDGAGVGTDVDGGDSGSVGDGAARPRLAQPARPSATDGLYAHVIRVTWDAVPEAESYALEHATAPDGPWSTLNTTPALAYSHGELDEGTVAYYRIVATAPAHNDSPASSVEQGSTAPTGGVLLDAYIKASNADAWDMFGGSIALSAVGDTLVVGARGEKGGSGLINGDEADNTLPWAGAVYVLVSNGSVWSQEAYIKPSNPDANDDFGNSLALAGDGNTLAVGVGCESSSASGVGGNQADNSAEQAGAVYIFIRNGASWSQQAYVKASNTDAADMFGRVSLSADGDTLVVGAHGEDGAGNGAVDSGAAYVFVRVGATWSQQAYIRATNADAGDHFGAELTLSADGNTLAVGAYGEASNATGVNGNKSDNTAPLAGAAYVFLRIGSTWTEQAYLKASNTNAGDLFGHALELSASGDTLVVGATGERSMTQGIDGDESDNSAENAGAVYVFVRSGGTWTQEAYVKGSNTEAGDMFGYSLAVTATGEAFAASALMEDSSATGVDDGQQDNMAEGAGAVYLFYRLAGVWSQHAYVKASVSEPEDHFGRGLALSDDGVILAVGADAEDSGFDGTYGDPADNSAEHSGAVSISFVEWSL